MAFFRRTKPTDPAAGGATTASPEREDTSFPPWALSSIFTWLAPFFYGAGPEASGYTGLGSTHERSFLREIERNMRLTLNWGMGDRGAVESLIRHMERDPDVLVKVVDYALHNPMLGYTFQEYDHAVDELDRTLREAGSAWCVRRTPRRVECYLELRSDAAAGEAVAALAASSSRDSEHLRNAWKLAYGQSPNPSEAYREAVKAVEVVAIRVVLPNDPTATLGRIIASMRQGPGKWKTTFDQRVACPQQQGVQHAPIEVILQMLDLLWKNQTDRHGVAATQPANPVTQEQAELAVNLALTLVQIFRSGAIGTV